MNALNPICVVATNANVLINLLSPANIKECFTV